MKRIEIEPGMKFNRLTIIKEVEKQMYGRTSIRRVLTKCDCGVEKVIPLNQVVKGGTKSCGCYTRELSAKLNYSHGLRHSKLYAVYRSMLNRCYLPTDTNYHKYGARGIKVCDKWRKIEGFLEDMQEFYKEGLSLERIDPNGDYCPSNCRWIPLKEQAYNKRNTLSIVINGEKRRFVEFVNEYGLDYQAAYKRIFINKESPDNLISEH